MGGRGFDPCLRAVTYFATMARRWGGPVVSSPVSKWGPSIRFGDPLSGLSGLVRLSASRTCIVGSYGTRYQGWLWDPPISQWDPPVSSIVPTYGTYSQIGWWDLAMMVKFANLNGHIDNHIDMTHR
jgi:hypothetical protein